MEYLSWSLEFCVRKPVFLRKIAILAHCKPYIAAYFCKQRNFIV